MDAIDTAIWKLENQLIPVIQGKCCACDEPCQRAYNGQGHENVCSCHAYEDPYVIDGVVC